MDILSFPNLGISFNLNKVAFHLLGLPIYWYSVIIATGVLLAVFYTQKRSRQFGIHPDGLFDVTIGGIIGGIIGARVYYIIFAWEEFQGNLGEIFNIRSGGLAIYGGIIGGAIVGYLLCKWRKVKPLPALDLAGLGFLIGQSIGRWGNFVNMEAFGSNTTLPWGMTSQTIENHLRSVQPQLAATGITVDPTMPVHPTFLYESLWCALGFLVLHFYSKKRRYDGEIFTLYVAWYSLGRFFIEGLRTDSLYAGNMRASRLVAAILFIVAIIAWVIIRGLIKRENDENFMKLYVLTDESKKHLEEADEKLLLRSKKKEKSENIEASKKLEILDTDENIEEVIETKEESTLLSEEEKTEVDEVTNKEEYTKNMQKGD